MNKKIKETIYGKEINKLAKESVAAKKECEFCQEAYLDIGKKSNYGSVIVYKIGHYDDGWYATLSPRTGGNTKTDFTIQLMPFAHLTHFSQIIKYPGLAENFGFAFSKLSLAMSKIMSDDLSLKATAESREKGIAIGSYGKCTTWKEKKEHLHIKLFQFRGDIGQPYTVDSSFGRKDICLDSESGKEFVKMNPVKKKPIGKDRFEELSKSLINLLK